MNRKIYKILITIVLVLAIICGFIYWTGRTAERTYQKRAENETSTELDVYKMQNYAAENAKKALKALEKEDANELSKLINNPSNVDKLIEYADWEKLDLDNKTSFGTGSFMPEPDKKGRMDVGEQIILNVGKGKYAIYIQTVTSRYGKVDEGISCIAVTTWKHFNEIDYAWKWQTDSGTLRAGKPFI